MAVLYHARQHGHCDRPGIVLVQGVATVRADHSEEALAQLAERAAAHIGQVVQGRFWDWWLEAYYLDRVRSSSCRCGHAPCETGGRSVGCT